MEETEQILGTVKSLRKDGTAVCITILGEEGEFDEWFNLAEAVKPSYIHPGTKIEDCKVSKDIDETGNRVLFFIKCEKPANRSFPAFKAKVMPNTNPYKSEKSDNVMQSMIIAEAVFHGTGKAEEFKEFQKEVLEYLNKNIWITTQKG